jgi:hypothetical protein
MNLDVYPWADRRQEARMNLPLTCAGIFDEEDPVNYWQG